MSAGYASRAGRDDPALAMKLLLRILIFVLAGSVLLALGGGLYARAQVRARKSMARPQSPA
jgi:hypothetical protein